MSKCPRVFCPSMLSRAPTTPLTCLRVSQLVATVVILMALVTPPCLAEPPEYATFGRAQTSEYAPHPDNIMRIWVAYVGQGDGILIQLPPRCNYVPEDHSMRSERVDVLIDGGSFDSPDAERMKALLLDLYEDPIIEHAVISHHDSDHVTGLGRILDTGNIAVESVYHNGLASYAHGRAGFTDSTTAKMAVIDPENSNFKRAMAFLEPSNDGNGEMLSECHLIDSIEELRERLNGDEFHNVYRDLACAIVSENHPSPVALFQRCVDRGPFVNEREESLDRGVNLDGIRFNPIWPLARPRRYGDWGETINGNSVTFRLDYGDFSMLFPGDHNQKSEKRLMSHLEEKDRLNVLDVDVLKVPHHGSSHAYEPFFRQEDENGSRPRAVISAASMGRRGFGTSWKHPSEKVVQWLGGAHRVYHTYIGESRVKWEDLDSVSDRSRRVEEKHVLIETDGEWFRVVEVDVKSGTPDSPPSVMETRRGNGTRWIRAR